MFCKKCGATIKDGETFCPSCGECISVEKNAHEDSILQDNHTERHSTGWITLLRFCAWLAFAIVVIGGMVMFSGNDFAVLIFLLSTVVGLLILAGIMINLDKAEDIRNIRNTLESMYSKSNNSDCNNEKK